MKRALKVAVVGVCLGLIMVIVQQAFQIDEEVFMCTYWIMAPVMIAAAVLVYVLYYRSYQRKMHRIAVLLDTGKTEEYIAGVEKLLRTVKGQNLRNVLELNLAAGYMEAEQLDTAILLLEVLAEKHLSGPELKMVHRLNLCLCYFYNAQNQKAMDLYQENQKIFGKYRNSKAYGGNIAAVDIFAAMQNGMYDRAEELLDTARRSWEEPRLQEVYQKLDNSLKEVKNADVQSVDS